jgi:hypothetical protein
MGKKYKLKKVEAITKDKDGVITFNLNADLGNADWIRTARLPKAGQEKRFNTPMYKVIEEDDPEFDEIEGEIYDDSKLNAEG